jgi:hypothetical protein
MRGYDMDLQRSALPGTPCARIAARERCRRAPIPVAQSPRLSLGKEFMRRTSVVRFGAKYLHFEGLVDK